MSKGFLARRRVALPLALAFVMAGLGATASGAMAHRTAGAVYTLTNSPAGNAVKVFRTANDGSLSADDEFPTGGTGTGTSLGSQGALTLDDHRLFAVNPGSDSVSSFRVTRDGLQLVDTEPSGGVRPISVTVSGRVLYVLNDGGAGNITGFTVSRSGQLTPLAGSTRPLSTGGAGPAEVSFDYDGDRLVVTEKNTNLIDSYKIDRNGIAGDLVTAPSSGMTPFGFAFASRDRLIVTEAFGGAVDQSALSSYRFEDGLLSPVTKSLGTTETAACWVVVTGDGRYAYATNTGSASISGYRIGRRGELTLLDADGKTGNTGATPIDIARSSNSQFIYELSSGSDTISGFRVEGDGSLTPTGAPAATPDGAVGLAAQ